MFQKEIRWKRTQKSGLLHKYEILRRLEIQATLFINEEIKAFYDPIVCNHLTLSYGKTLPFSCLTFEDDFLYFM